VKQSITWLRTVGKKLLPGIGRSPRTQKNVAIERDLNFLQSLRINEVQAALQSGDTDVALELAGSHFRRKFSTIAFAVPQRIIAPKDREREVVLSRAEELLSKRFSLAEHELVSFDSGVDWRFDPTKDRRARWARELNRHRWAATLALAYSHSKNPLFLSHCLDLILDWIEQCPPLVERCEGDVSWTLMGVGFRSSVWCSVLPLISQVLPDRQLDVVRVVRSIAQHGEYLCAHKTSGNHLIVESNSLATLALRFTEFTASERFLRVAVQRLMEELNNQVNPDGSHYEMSIPYQWFVVGEYAETLDLLTTDDQNFDVTELQRKLASMYEYLAYSIRPDGCWALLGDGFHFQALDRRDRLLAVSKKFGRSDFEYIGTQGLQGEEPRSSSRLFPEAGVAHMRQHWREDAHFLSMTFGSFGGWHGHEDKLSIELCAFGEAFIRDPGSFTYDAGDPRRNYFLSSSSHSTLTIDGLSQARRWLPHNHRPVLNVREPAIWHSEAKFDLAAARYDEGYGDYSRPLGKGPGKTSSFLHDRIIIWVKPDYWLILDKVHCDSQCTVTRHFQFAEDMKVAATNTAAVATSTATGNRVEICNLPLGHRADARVLHGSSDPMGGWVSNGYRNHMVAAPQLLFEHRPNQHGYCVTAICPARHSERKSIAIVEEHGVSTDQTMLEFVLEVGDKRDHHRIQFEPSSRDAGNPADFFSQFEGLKLSCTRGYGEQDEAGVYDYTVNFGVQ